MDTKFAHQLKFINAFHGCIVAIVMAKKLCKMSKFAKVSTDYKTVCGNVK